MTNLSTVSENADSPAIEQEEAQGLRILRGTDDSLPQRQILRERILANLREVFELFGFSPCETPILNYFDILSSKYGGGAEILKETYQLTDQGGRDLGLRYDLTVPFARLVGMYQAGQIRLPFKRYEIGKVFRNGPVRAGRRREFYQCDVDFVGCPAPFADAELILLADMAFKRLGLKVRCEVNHRGILSGLIRAAGIAPEKAGPVILALDKLKKIGNDGVTTELTELGISGEASESLFKSVSVSPDTSNTDRLAVAKASLGNDEAALAAVDEMQAVLDVIDEAGASLEIEFQPSLARGLDIYTGIVFEYFALPVEGAKKSAVTGAIGAGGRYDNIIGSFLSEFEEGDAGGQQNLQGDAANSAASFPAAGMSFGLEPITILLAERDENPADEATVAEALLIPIATEVQAQRIATALREAGARIEVNYARGRMKKHFRRAEALGIPFALILGGDELEKGEISVRHLPSSEQRQLSTAAAAEAIVRARAGEPPFTD